jgi:hypothetical protein
VPKAKKYAEMTDKQLARKLFSPAVRKQLKQVLTAIDDKPLKQATKRKKR